MRSSQPSLSSQTTNTEVEVRFINADISRIKKNLVEIGAIDHGEDFLKEIIFYDKEKTFPKLGKVIRIRNLKDTVLLAYKHHPQDKTKDTIEIEQEITDASQMTLFLEAVGFIAFRQQEKKRHTYTLGDIVIDIDTWPTMPPYIEIEGKSEAELKETAEKLGLAWKDAIRESAAYVIEHYYHIPVKTLRYFTFEKIA